MFRQDVLSHGLDSKQAYAAPATSLVIAEPLVGHHRPTVSSQVYCLIEAAWSA